MSLLLLLVPNSPVHLAAAPGQHLLLQLLLLLPTPTLRRAAADATDADARFRSPPPLGNLSPSPWRPLAGGVVRRGTHPRSPLPAAATVILRDVALVR